MVHETPSQRPVSKRNVLKMLGAGVFVGSSLTTSVAAQSSGRPTVSLSSPGCEQLRVHYSQGRAPLTAIVSGPEAYTVELGPGESDTRTVEGGQYVLTARPSRAYAGDEAIVVEDSPQTVPACEQGGLIITPICDPSHYYPNHARITNTTDDNLRFKTEMYNGEELLNNPTGGWFPASASNVMIIDPEAYAESFGKEPTHMIFSATIWETTTVVPVTPSRLDFPEDLPCN